MNIETLAQQHQLGQMVSAHGWYKPIYRLNLYMMLFFLPFVLLSVALIVGIPIGILYAVLLVMVIRRVSSTHNVFYVFEQGILDCRKGKPVVVRYDDIAQLWFWMRLDVAPFFIKVHREEYKVKLLNGQTHQFIQTIQGIREVGDYLQTQFLNHQFPKAIAQLQRNEKLDFAGLKLGTDGLYRGKKFLSWDELEIARVESVRAGGNVYVSLVIRKKGQRHAWASFPRQSFPNLSLFLAVVQTIQAQKLYSNNDLYIEVPDIQPAV